MFRANYLFLFLLLGTSRGNTNVEYLSMFNENEPVNRTESHFEAQSSFANLFVYHDIPTLVDAHNAYNGSKCFLSIQRKGIWKVPASKWRNMNETGLEEDWESALSTVFDEAESHFHSGALSGFFLGDELATRGVPVKNITNVAAAIKTTFHSRNITGLVYLNEGTGPFDPNHARYAGTWSGSIPPTIDLISLDMYCLERPDSFDIAWPNCTDPAGEVALAKAFYESQIIPRLTSNTSANVNGRNGQNGQRLLVVPGIFMDGNETRSGPVQAQEQYMLGKLAAYWAWAQAEPLIIGVNVWHWTTSAHAPSVGILPFYYGVDHMPQVQRKLVLMSEGTGTEP